MKREIVTRTEKIIFLSIWAVGFASMIASNWTVPPLSFLLGLLALVLFAVYFTFCMILWRRMRRANEERRRR